MPVYNNPQRPSRRDDGWPTRADIRYDTDAERLCRVLVGLVESMGASVPLTRAVILLGQARDAIADHVERIEPEPPASDEPARRCICDGGSYIDKMPTDWRPFIVEPTCPTHGDEPARCEHGKTEAHRAPTRAGEGSAAWWDCPGPTAVLTHEWRSTTDDTTCNRCGIGYDAGRWVNCPGPAASGTPGGGSGTPGGGS